MTFSNFPFYIHVKFTVVDACMTFLPTLLMTCTILKHFSWLETHYFVTDFTNFYFKTCRSSFLLSCTQHNGFCSYFGQKMLYLGYIIKDGDGHCNEHCWLCSSTTLTRDRSYNPDTS